MQREHRAHARTMTSHQRHPTVLSDLITGALNLSMNSAYRRNTVCLLTGVHRGCSSDWNGNVWKLMFMFYWHELGFLLFWDVASHSLVVGTVYHSHLQGSCPKTLVLFCPFTLEDGNDMSYRNVGNHLSTDGAQHHRRAKAATTPQRKSEISRRWTNFRLDVGRFLVYLQQFVINVMKTSSL